jgi:hypothetical protein
MENDKNAIKIGIYINLESFSQILAIRSIKSDLVRVD